MIRALPFLVLLLPAGLACGPPAEAPAADALFADPHAVEVLTEEAELGPPVSEGPNRFSRGWRPWTVEDRRVLRATPGGASLEVATVVPGERTLALDLAAPDAVRGMGHLEIRIDGGPATLVPVADPLAIRLPEDLEPGRHRVALAFREAGGPPLLVAGSAIRPARPAGAARMEGGDLVQVGPSLVDVAARPGAGAALAGEVCPPGFLAGTEGVAVTVIGSDGATRGRWTGGAAPWSRLRGCRGVELGAVGDGEPVRVRLAVPGEGVEVRWRGWRWLSAPAAPEPPRPAAEAPPPSPPRLVVLYVMDALRADFVGHLGGPEGISPVLDRLAREGATVRRHWSTGPNTLAAMPDLFTGEVWVTRRSWAAAGAARPTLAEALEEAGYRTGLFSGNEYLIASLGLADGFDHVSEEALYDLSTGGEPDVNRSAERVHAAALEWLDGLAGQEPLFLHLQTVNPHNPYAPPPDLERRFTAGIPSAIEGDTRTLVDLQRGRRSTTAADRARLRGLYAASFAYNDRDLGRFLEALAARYPPEETLLVVTSDHGDELFDHGGALHGYTLYEELLHVPLVVHWPGTVRPGTGGPGGRDPRTDHLDLHATLLDAAGALDRAPGAGRSLLPLLTGRAGGLPDRLLFAAATDLPGGAQAVLDGRWKLIRVAGTEERWAMGVGPGRSWDREYLFDLADDPGELRNLAGQGGVREQWLRARLRTWLAGRRAEGAGEEPAAEPPLDEEARRRLRALGYLD